ncbi:uncharacterized protein UTRI_05610 [Ustilago trichophora]|uniref:Integrase catalytic domain-containing protein n=1 Tax=Ustilago trichophora TaxID=86804 RepID=A0A5C3EHE7_9BASI|nr:uncharacterized protein UTRI_05610 [Ustilago trichophora]
MTDKEASLIGIPRLKSVDDYFTWKDDFTAAMMAKGKVYICMTQGMPEVTAWAREEWMEADIKAKGFILQAIGQEYRHLVKSLPTPMEMWQRLQGHFEEHKEGEGIDPYSARIAKICEQLDAAGYKTDVDRQMKALVQGLRPEYGVYKAMLMRENDTYRKLIKKEIMYTDADGKQHTVTQGLNELDEIERYNDALRTLKAREEELNQTGKAKDSSKIEMAIAATSNGNRPFQRKEVANAATEENDNQMPNTSNNENREQNEEPDVWGSNINFTVDNKLTAAEVTANGKKVLQCKYEGNSLILKGHTIQYKAANLAIIKNNDIEAWHRRLGHINTKSVTRLTRPLELVHSDVVGPYETDIDGKRYMVTFVDDFSRHVTGVPIETKDKVATAFYFYSIHMEGRTGKKLSMLLSDNGGEFVNKEMDDYMRRRGIVHRRTAPYTPQQNGIAERMNRTVMDMAYEVVDLSLLNKRISRDITFVETDFPAKRKEVQPPNAQEVITTTTLEESNEEETSIGPGGEGDISEVELANLTTQVEFAATPRPEQDPLTLQEAQKRKDWNKWKEAMDKELESHRENGTWEVTSKPTSDGHVVDSTSLGLKMEQMDVVTAFLNGVITEDIFMKPPPGYWEGKTLNSRRHYTASNKLEESGTKGSMKVCVTWASLGLPATSEYTR